MRSIATTAIIAMFCVISTRLIAQTTYERDLACESSMNTNGTRYLVGEEFQLKAQFVNMGTADIESGRILANIYDAPGNLISQQTAALDSVLKPGESREVTIGSYHPLHPGRYSFRFCADMVEDEYPENDCSSRDTIYMVIDSSIAAGDPDNDPYLPDRNQVYSISEPVPIEVPFTNLSSHVIAEGVEFRAVINGQQGNVVYDRSINGTLAAGSTTGIRFPDFIPSATGTYRLFAWSRYIDDDIPENDTISWSFTVGQSSSSSSPTSVASEGSRLQVLPNPATHSATIHYTMHRGPAALITIIDGIGRRVKSMRTTRESGTIALDVADLPHGIYTVQLVSSVGESQSTRMIVWK